MRLVRPYINTLVIFHFSHCNKELVQGGTLLQPSNTNVLQNGPDSGGFFSDKGVIQYTCWKTKPVWAQLLRGLKALP